MPITKVDTFTATDGSSWSADWTFPQGSGDIQGNRGRMVTGTGPFDGDSAQINVDLADVQVGISVEIPTNDAQFPEIRFRFSDVNFDYIRLLFEPHNDLYLIHDYDNDVQTSLLASGSYTIVAGDVVYIRMEGEGSTVRFRFWKNAEQEPSTWTATATSTLGQTNTLLMVRTVTSNLGVAVTNFWDNLVVGEHTPQPPARRHRPLLIR
jgi:hypothetical protein